MTIAYRSGLCIEIAHEEDFISWARVAVDPKEHMLDLKPTDIIVDFIDRMVQMRIDKDEVTIWVARVAHLDHRTVANSTQMENLMRDKSILAEERRIGHHSVTILFEVRIWAAPHSFVLDLGGCQVLLVASLL